MKRVCITGAGGMLGLALEGAIPPGVEVHPLDRRALDTTDGEAVEAALGRIRPDVVFHFAAMTAVDRCESEPEEAHLQNVVASRYVVGACRRIDARLVFPSSDYVFDGTLDRPYLPTDPCRPLSVYGKSKFEAERGVLEMGPAALVVRTSWLFGHAGSGKVSFVDRILDLARTRPELRVVDDQQGRPTYAVHLARTLLRLVERGRSGVIHAANSGTCTWHGFAAEILRQAGLSTPVIPITTRQLGLPAPRPANSVLDLTGLSALGLEMPPWQAALAEYLRVRSAPSARK